MKSVVSTSQLTLDFEPGLTERHDTLLACVRTCAHSHRNPLKTIAADLNRSIKTVSTQKRSVMRKLDIATDQLLMEFCLNANLF